MVVSTVLSYLLILFLSTIVCIYFYFKYSFRYWKTRNIDTLEPTFPFGNMKKLFDGVTHISVTIEELYKKIKGPFAGVFCLNSPMLLVKDPALLKYILVKDFSYFTDRGIHSDENNDPLTGHLFRLTGQKWRNLRIKLSPTFTSGKLKMMFPILVKTGQNLQDSLEKAANDGNYVNMKDICSSFTIDVISSVAFGNETNSFNDPDNEMRTFVTRFTRNSSIYLHGVINNLTTCLPSIVQRLKLRVFSDKFTEFLFSLIRRVIDYRENNKIIRNDFLQLLIQLKNTGAVADDETAGDVSMYEKKTEYQGLTFNELAAQAFIFIIAGYETSANTMTFCLYELAKNPEIQRRVQQDVDETLAKHDGQFTYNSVADMQYLDMVVSETLRLYPALGFLNRVVKEDYQIPDSDILLEKNTKIIISVNGLHRDPNFFPDPMKFDPERFSPENKDKIIPYTYLPFGEGPRICIGLRMGKMQTTLGLAMILHKYNFSLCHSSPTKVEPAFGQIISTPTMSVNLLITKRAES